MWRTHATLNLVPTRSYADSIVESADDSPALRLALAGWTAQRLGLLFKRAAGIPVDGYVVVRVGKAGNAARGSGRGVGGGPGDSRPREAGPFTKLTRPTRLWLYESAVGLVSV